MLAKLVQIYAVTHHCWDYGHLWSMYRAIEHGVLLDTSFFPLFSSTYNRNNRISESTQLYLPFFTWNPIVLGLEGKVQLEPIAIVERGNVYTRVTRVPSKI